MAIIRISLNLIYLPILQNNNKEHIYRDHIQQIIVITKSSPVYFTGDPMVLESTKFGKFKIHERRLITPPVIPYQVPYYLMRSNHHIMQFHPKPEKGNFYIAYKDFIGNNKILYTFREMYTGENLYLFRAD